MLSIHIRTEQRDAENPAIASQSYSCVLVAGPLIPTVRPLHTLTMKTILDHLDDLDRMIDAGNTPKSELRFQIDLIGKLVAALEQDYAATIQNEAKLQQAQANRNERAWKQLEQESDEYRRMLQSKQLKHF